MTLVDRIVSKLTRFSSWLISRQWEREEILIAVAIALFLLLLVLRTRRKAKTRIRYVPPSYTPRSTIGVRLTNPAARN
jgi:hypothetical protein